MANETTDNGRDSLGEYAALVIAGVLDLFDGLKLVAHRASLIMQHCELGQTSMLATNSGAVAVQSLIDATDEYRDLAIACNNSETDCVVGGPVPQLSLLKRHLGDSNGTKSKLLEVPLAFHTRAMDPILAEFNQFASREVRLKKPLIPIVSNTLGRTVAVGEEAFSPEYFAKQCRQAVSFDEGIKDLLTKSDVVASSRWIEIGPHASIQPMLRQRLKTSASTQTYLPTLVKTASPADTMGRLLCHFYESSVGVDWRKVFSRNASKHPYKLIDLPGMPFFKEDYHVPYEELVTNPNSERSMSSVPTPVLANSFAARVVRRFLPGVVEGHAIYDTPALSISEFIEGHIVCGTALCPASVYHQMALAALDDMNLASTSGTVRSLVKISYPAPFVYDTSLTQVLRVFISPRAAAPDSFDFNVSSYMSGFDPETSSTVHCRGMIKHKMQETMSSKFHRLQASMKGKIDDLRQGTKRGLEMSSSPASHRQVFSRTSMYDKIFPRVVRYSEPYQKVQSIHTDDATGEALATCVFPNDRLEHSSSTIPAANVVFMDMMLHVAGFIANLNVDNAVMGICKEVGAATILRAPVDNGAAPKKFDIYCSTYELRESHSEAVTVADAYALDSEGIFAVFRGMAFQHVELARIGQALSLANRLSKKSIGRIAAYPGGEVTRKDIPTDAATLPLKVNVVTDIGRKQGEGHGALHQTFARDLVAKVCGLDPKALTVNSRLDSLGVDSLMMIELEAELESYTELKLSSSALACCETVGDIECLCGASGLPVTPKDTGSPSETTSESACVTPDSSMQTSIMDSADNEPKAMNITEVIASLCGTPTDAVSLDSELTSLGIDSLMFLELEDSLRDHYGSISHNQLQECRVVGDIKKLVCGQILQTGGEARTAVE